MSKKWLLVVVTLMLSACVAVPQQPEDAARAEKSSGAEVTKSETASQSEDAARPEAIFQSGGAVITLVRSGGLAGQTLRWDIYADGRITSSAGPTTTVPADQVKGVVSEIEKLGFFELADPGGKVGKCADCYTYEITVRAAGKDRTLTTISPASGAPAQLLQIMEKINGLLEMLPKS